MTSAVTNDVLIDATGIDKSFPGVRALAGVSLQVRAGRRRRKAHRSTFYHLQSNAL